MTDIHETPTVRSHAASDARTILFLGLAAAQKLGRAMVELVYRPSPQDPGTRAERARLAESLREDARRRVDRLMM